MFVEFEVVPEKNDQEYQPENYFEEDLVIDYYADEDFVVNYADAKEYEKDADYYSDLLATSSQNDFYQDYADYSADYGLVEGEDLL